MAILKDFKFYSPGSLSEAVELLDKSKSPMLLAGGTFVLNTLKKTSKYPQDVISLKNIAELKGIKVQGKELCIGPMTRIDELINSAFIGDNFPSLKDAALRLGTTPIRNMATIGGNITSRFYWVDLPAVLISLSARVKVIEAKKERSLDLYDFLKEKTSKNTILVEILLPLEKRDAIYFRHTRTVQEVDVPYLGVAFSCMKNKSGISDQKLVVNTTLSLPVSFTNTSSLLEGLKYRTVKSEDINDAVLKDAKGTKLDEYRMHLIGVDVETILNSLKDKK